MHEVADAPVPAIVSPPRPKRGAPKRAASQDTVLISSISFHPCLSIPLSITYYSLTATTQPTEDTTETHEETHKETQEPEPEEQPEEPGFEEQHEQRHSTWVPVAPSTEHTLDLRPRVRAISDYAAQGEYLFACAIRDCTVLLRLFSNLL